MDDVCGSQSPGRNDLAAQASATIDEPDAEAWRRMRVPHSAKIVTAMDVAGVFHAVSTPQWAELTPRPCEMVKRWRWRFPSQPRSHGIPPVRAGLRADRENVNVSAPRTESSQRSAQASQSEPAGARAGGSEEGHEVRATDQIRGIDAPAPCVVEADPGRGRTAAGRRRVRGARGRMGIGAQQERPRGDHPDRAGEPEDE